MSRVSSNHATTLNLVQTPWNFVVRSGLLAKLFKIYVVVAFSLNFSIYVVGSPLACPLGRLGPLPHPLVSRVSSNHATTLNLVQTPWNFVDEFGFAGNPNKGHSVSSQLDQTEPWYCRRIQSIFASLSHGLYSRSRARVALGRELQLPMSFPWPIFPGLDQDLFPPWFSSFFGIRFQNGAKECIV